VIAHFESLRSARLATRVTGVSVVLAVVVAAAFIALVLAISALRESTEQAVHAKNVSTSTLELEKLVLDTETSLRGYVLTKNSRFLDPFRSAVGALPGAIRELDRQVASDPAEQRRVRELSEQIRAYVSDYAKPLVAIAKIDPAAARAGVAAAEGKLRIDELRRRFTQILGIEDARAATRAKSAREESKRAIWIGIGAIVATALFILAFALYIARQIARPVREVAEAAGRVSEGDLTPRLAEHGAGEVYTLKQSFNVMTTSLDRQKRELEHQNEQLRESEQLRSELVSIVSHELRTPLASVLGYSSLLLRRDFDPETTRRYLEIIRSQGDRIATLVDDLVDVRRAERGALEIRRQHIDLAQVLQEQVAVFSGRSDRHEITLRLLTRPLELRGDRGRLEQVVANLIANAVKYSPAGGEIEVVGDRRRSLIRVEVVDQGMGIPPESQPQVFTKFFRGEARASGIAGAGLGLAIAREIVEAHGGHIGFWSTPGSGSTFWFEVPAAEGSEALPLRAVEAVVPSAPASTR
jgi:signal transduction histidine kinase